MVKIAHMRQNKMRKRFMDKRKKKIIDRKFQLHTTYSFMSIFFVLIGIIIFVIGINIYNDNKRIEKILEEQQNIVNDQNDTISSMLQMLNVKYGNESELREKIKEKSGNNTSLMKNNMNILKDLTLRNNTIFFLLILFLISTGFILYPVLIRKTHKISGPIYIMSEYMRDILKGNFPDPRPLREKDELKEFYELFSQVVMFITKKHDKSR